MIKIRIILYLSKSYMKNTAGDKILSENHASSEMLLFNNNSSYQYKAIVNIPIKRAKTTN